MSTLRYTVDGSPIVSSFALIGKHKDEFQNPNLQQKIISDILEARLRRKANWLLKIVNVADNLVYFPVDNCLGCKDKVVQSLMKALVSHTIGDENNLAHKEIPLSWYHTLDELCSKSDHKTFHE